MKNNQAENIIIKKINGAEAIETNDYVAVEEPLEIQLAYSTATGYMQKNIAVTMRTPGNDEELAVGFLFTEGIINNGDSIKEVKHIGSDHNRVIVVLHENILPALNISDRNFYTTSSCGICGKASIDAIQTVSIYKNEPDNMQVNARSLYSLTDQLRKQQEVFENTGGIHACALFTLNADLIMLREDVGRHNALDKLIGFSMLQRTLPLTDCILLLSGRASFELLQKATMAGIKIIVAVGAPSSLAVEMAKESGITLIGFLRNDRFNIYSEQQRIIL